MFNNFRFSKIVPFLTIWRNGERNAAFPRQQKATGMRPDVALYVHCLPCPITSTTTSDHSKSTFSDYVYYNQRSFKTYFLSFNSLMTQSCKAVTKDFCSRLSSHSYLDEVLPVDDMKAHMEVEVQFHPFFPLALHRGDWLFHALATLFSRRSPRDH